MKNYTNDCLELLNRMDLYLAYLVGRTILSFLYESNEFRQTAD